MADNMSIKKATIINFISRYSTIFIQLIINSILARLLTPDDYGIVAVITVFTGFFTLIADMGIGAAIIQNKELDSDEISSIFNFTVITAIIISIIFCFLSYPISRFYNNSIYIPLGVMLSFSIFFNVVNIVPNSLLLKNKEFKFIGIRTVVITIVSGIITIIFAFLNFKYYTIVLNSILMGLLTFTVNMLNVKIKLSTQFNWSGINKIKSYSSYQFAFSFVNYFSRNLDNLLIGKYMGQSALGYYDKAYKLMLYPVQNLTFVITPVLHPILSEYQNDKDKIYNQYIKVVKLLALLGTFFTVFCYFAGEEIICIMFGVNWLKSVPAFKILSLSIIIQMVLSSSGSIFQATGETRGLFLAGFFGAIANILGIIVGMFLGKIEYVAFGIVIGYGINFFTGFYLLICKVFKKKFILFIRSFISSIIIIGIMSSIILFCNFTIENVFLSAVYKFLICIIGYLIGLFITREYKFMYNLLLKK